MREMNNVENKETVCEKSLFSQTVSKKDELKRMNIKTEIINRKKNVIVLALKPC